MRYRTLYLGADVQSGYLFCDKRAMMKHDCGVKVSLTLSETRSHFGIKRFHVYGDRPAMPGWCYRELEDYCLDRFPCGKIIHDSIIAIKATEILIRYFFPYSPLSYCNPMLDLGCIYYEHDCYDRIVHSLDQIGSHV